MVCRKENADCGWGARRSLAILVAVWLLLVVLGTAALWAYRTLAGSQASAPTDWPAISTLPAPSTRPTLILALLRERAQKISQNLAITQDACPYFRRGFP